MGRLVAIGLLLFMVMGALGQGSQLTPQTTPPAVPSASADEQTVPPPPAKLLNPETATAPQLERQGDELRAQKLLLDAVDSYQAAIRKKPTAVLYDKRGMTYVLLQRIPDARRDFERAIKMDKKYAVAYNNLGSAYYIIGKFSKAISLYRKAISIDSSVASFHCNLGSAYLRRKKIPDAVKSFTEAVRLDPTVLERSSVSGVSSQVKPSPEDHAHFDYLMAKTFAGTGDAQRSLQYLRKAMEEGYKDINDVYKDQEFASLRATEEFKQLMTQKIEAIRQ